MGLTGKGGQNQREKQLGAAADLAIAFSIALFVCMCVHEAKRRSGVLHHSPMLL